MLPPELAPIRVGLDSLLVVYQKDELRNLNLGHTQSKWRCCLHSCGFQCSVLGFYSSAELC